MQKNILCLFCCIIFFFPLTIYAGVKVVQVGVASPQTDAEKGNIEKLRKRALTNAAELALQRVTGVEISTVRGGSSRQRWDVTTHNNKSDEYLHQQDRQNSAVRTRTEGHARLLTINREWQKQGQYYVEATFMVETPEEILAHNNAGYYWRGAGQPSIGLKVTEDISGDVEDDKTHQTLQFFKENLTRNGLKVSTSTTETEYLIEVNQSLRAKEQESLGTITMHCRLSYQVVDQVTDEILGEYRAANGPVAGFTSEQARQGCLKTIAPKVADRLVRQLAKIMNNRWNNGVDLEVVITNVPGDIVPRLTNVITNLFQVSSAAPVSYTNSTYRQRVDYKGTGSEFAQAFQDALADDDWSVNVVTIDKREIRLHWTKKN